MNGPGNQSPGGSRRSAPYSKSYAAGGGVVNLTTEISQSQGATSGFVLMPGLTAFTYKDCTGRSVAVTGLTITFPVDYPLAAIELSSSAGGALVAYWHPNATS
jgi:hypothetical protein